MSIATFMELLHRYQEKPDEKRINLLKLYQYEFSYTDQNAHLQQRHKNAIQN